MRAAFLVKRGAATAFVMFVLFAVVVVVLRASMRAGGLLPRHTR